jgi:hypothetical protein
LHEFVFIQEHAARERPIMLTRLGDIDTANGLPRLLLLLLLLLLLWLGRIFSSSA